MKQTSILELIEIMYIHIQREKKMKKIEVRQSQQDNKERMQEELIRKSLQREVSIQEAHEKARRIKESHSQMADEDDAKSKAIDMLVDVQKQLLDVFAISKVLYLIVNFSQVIVVDDLRLYFFIINLR